MKTVLRSLLTVAGFLSASSEIQAQDSERVFLFGQISAFESENLLEGSHILNLQTGEISVSDAKGFFRILGKADDQMVFSSVGYLRDTVRIKVAFLHQRNTVFPLRPKAYLLENIDVGKYHLSGHIDIDTRIIPSRAIKRVITGFPNGETVSKIPRTPPSILNPSEFLYDLFGNLPQQIRMIKSIRKQRKKIKKHELRSEKYRHQKQKNPPR